MGWHQLVAAVCTVFSLAMLVLVVTSHQWISVQSFTQIYASGIWKTCTKVVCVSIHANIAYFELIRVLMVLALFSGFFCSSYMLFTYRYLPSFRLSRFLFSALGCFITGFLMVLAMTIYTVFIAKRGIYKTAHVTYLPTFYLGWCLGPFFATSVGLLNMMGHSSEILKLLNTGIDGDRRPGSGFLCLMAHYFMPVHRISLADQDSITRSFTSDVRILSTDSCRHGLGLSSVAAL